MSVSKMEGDSDTTKTYFISSITPNNANTRILYRCTEVENY